MNKASLDYNKLIKTSWEMVKKRPYLWILGILGGSGMGIPNTGSGWNFDEKDWKSSFKDLDLGQVAGAATSKFNELTDVFFISFMVAVLILVIIVLIIGTIFRGGLIQMTKDIAESKKNNFGLAWQAGVKTFWPLFGLQLLALVIVALFFGPLILTFMMTGAFGNQNPSDAIMLTSLLFMVIWLIVLIVFFVLFTLIYPYIERCLVLEKVSIREAINQAVHFFRTHWLEVVVVDLISIAFGIIWAIAAIIALFLIVLLGGILVAALYFLSPALGIAVGIILAVPLFIILLMAGGFISSYVSILFTGAYLALKPHTSPP